MPIYLSTGLHENNYTQIEQSCSNLLAPYIREAYGRKIENQSILPFFALKFVIFQCKNLKSLAPLELFYHIFC